MIGAGQVRCGLAGAAPPAGGRAAPACRAIPSRGGAHFLDQISVCENRVLLSLPKQDIRPGPYLAQEVTYLTQEKGYVWVNQWALRPGG